jgi:hypothetical protein
MPERHHGRLWAEVRLISAALPTGAWRHGYPGKFLAADL